MGSIVKKTSFLRVFFFKIQIQPVVYFKANVCILILITFSWLLLTRYVSTNRILLFITITEKLLSAFKLDSLYYLTLASYAIQACYYDTGVVLDAISDPTLYDLLNRNIRGGFCSVGKETYKGRQYKNQQKFQSFKTKL